MNLRPATKADAPLIEQLIRELADYEKLAHECEASAERISQFLFGPAPRAHCVIAEADGQAAGFCLYFYNFSTFLSRPGIYIEDLFVRPAFRRRGIAQAVFKHLAAKALEEGCGRLEWAVLDWNTPALDFYATMGADSKSEWILQRVSGEALKKLAGKV